MIAIELPDQQVTALRAKAASEGLSLNAWLGKLALDSSPECPTPLKTGRGMLAKYGPAPSAEDIEENRRDMFRGFGLDI